MAGLVTAQTDAARTRGRLGNRYPGSSEDEQIRNSILDGTWPSSANCTEVVNLAFGTHGFLGKLVEALQLHARQRLEQTLLRVLGALAEKG